MPRHGFTQSAPLLMLLQVLLRRSSAAVAPVTWSKLSWAACNPDDAAQKFHLDPVSGRWEDKATGRCMSVVDKKQPEEFGKVALDTCGGADYKGTPSGQKWTVQPADTSKVGTGIAMDVHSPINPAQFCINLPLSDCQASQQCFDGFNFVTYKACGVPNSMLKFNKDGTVVSNDGFFKDKCLTQQPCNSESTPPCTLPSGWGTSFTIVVLLALVLYAGGGIGYAFKMRGAPLALASHPHHTQMLSLSGLVVDGLKYTVATITKQIAAGRGESTSELEAGLSGTAAAATKVEEPASGENQDDVGDDSSDLAE